MNKNGPLQLSDIICQIADSLQVGVILFDRHLTVIDMTDMAKTTICPESSIDLALQRGTAETMVNDWNEVFKKSLELGEKNVFTKIPYRTREQKSILNLTCIPIRERGQVVGGVLLIHDVTSERENAHETSQIEKLTAISRVAGKVAHELNNPLDGILRYANLSLRMIEQNQPQKAAEYINHCKDGLQRMTQIISDMLEFARNSHFAQESCPADKLLEDALRALDGCLKTIDVQVIRKDAGTMPHFKSELYQVFCNVLKNACDAMQGKGKLTITISRGKEHCQFEFCDTGPGFEPFTAEDIFKPFFTTKISGRGTGLGLSICRDILEKLGGQITAQNLDIGGACFTVYLPAGAPTAVRS